MLRTKLLAGVALAALLAACNPQSAETGAEDGGPEINDSIAENNIGGSAADRWADVPADPPPANGGGVPSTVPANDGYATDDDAGDYPADDYADSGAYDDYTPPAYGDAGYDDSDYAGNYYPDTAYQDFDYDSRYYDDYDRYGSDVDYDYFYDALSPHGEWFYHPRWGYVWAPARVGNDFRPYYSAGYWQNTYEFGWTWVSQYDWGNIPFHYGRWVFDPGDGWIWLPGYVWAPSWTIWRTGGDYVGWFPMPPNQDFLVGAEIYNNDWGNMDRGFGYADWYGPEYGGDWTLSLWTFVERDRFGNRDFRRWEAPRDRRRNIVQNTTNVTNYVTVNNYIVNRSVEEPATAPARDGGWQRRRARDVLGDQAPVTQASLGRDIQQRERGRFGGDEAASPRERLRPVPDDTQPTAGQTPPPEQPDRDPGDRRAARQQQQEQERAAREQQQQEQERAALEQQERETQERQEQERAAQQQQQQQEEQQQEEQGPPGRQQQREQERAARQEQQEQERAGREQQQQEQERNAREEQQQQERAAQQQQQEEQQRAAREQQEQERAAREEQQQQQQERAAREQQQEQQQEQERAARQQLQEQERAAQQAQSEAERAAREAQQAEQEAARAAQQQQQQQQEAERGRGLVIQQEEAARAARMEAERLEAERVRAEGEAEQERVRFEQQQQQQEEQQAAREEEQRRRQAEREAQRQERQLQREGEGQGEQPPQ